VDKSKKKEVKLEEKYFVPSVGKVLTQEEIDNLNKQK
jgi:hypothetical protein